MTQSIQIRGKFAQSTTSLVLRFRWKTQDDHPADQILYRMHADDLSLADYKSLLTEMCLLVAIENEWTRIEPAEREMSLEELSRKCFRMKDSSTFIFDGVGVW